MLILPFKNIVFLLKRDKYCNIKLDYINNILIWHTLSFAGSILFLLSSGCTSINLEEDRITETSIEINEKISFILDRSTIKDMDEAQKIEKTIEKCVDKELKELDPQVKTISADSFRASAFGSMDYFSVPSSTDSILTLLKTPEFKKRINSLGLRYLLVVQGGSDFSQKDCGGEGVIGGCSWRKNTQMTVSIIDLIKNCCSGEIKAKAEGIGWFALIGYIPIGFPAISEGPACDALGKKVVSFIVGNKKIND